jgi:hypothetical protein
LSVGQRLPSAKEGVQQIVQLADGRIVPDSEREVSESVDFLRKASKNAEEIEDLRAEPYLWSHLYWPF